MFGFIARTSVFLSFKWKEQASLLSALPASMGRQVLTKAFCMLYNKHRICSLFDNVGLAHARFGAVPVSYTKVLQRIGYECV